MHKIYRYHCVVYMYYYNQQTIGADLTEEQIQLINFEAVLVMTPGGRLP